MTLYHGSNVRVSDIDLSLCHPYKDFGQAFYLSPVREQAVDVALARVDFFGGGKGLRFNMLFVLSGL